MEITYGKVLGGAANGQEVPFDWSELDVAVWSQGGAEPTVYELRGFNFGTERHCIWVESSIPNEVVYSIMHWHQEMTRFNAVAAQKELIRDTFSAATQYTNVIMVAGYAAMFAFWTQMKSSFTTGTIYWSGFLLAVSVFTFVAWEIFGMVKRSQAMFAISASVNEPSKYVDKIRKHSEMQANFMRKLIPLWTVTIFTAAGTAVISFFIMLSAFIHGLTILK